VSAAELGALLSQTELLAALGEHCKTFMPGEPHSLIALAGLTRACSDSRTALAAFAAQREQDFRSGRVHTVDGWIMAEAECALCVLVAQS